MTPIVSIIKEVEEKWEEHLEMCPSEEVRNLMIIDGLANMLHEERRRNMFYKRYYEERAKA